MTISLTKTELTLGSSFGYYCGLWSYNITWDCASPATDDIMYLGLIKVKTNYVPQEKKKELGHSFIFLLNHLHHPLSVPLSPAPPPPYRIIYVLFMYKLGPHH